MPVKNECMGIYPFNPKKKQLFNSIVKPLIESHTGLTYVDASYYYESSSVKMDLISRMIEEARMVIVDLSENNPNVFLEIGIAHSFNKPIVLLVSRNSYDRIWKKKLPFDIEGRELLLFNNDNELKVKLGRFISDCLYKTKEITLSWESDVKENHIKSSTEIEIFKEGKIWSNIGINPNFIISYHVKLNQVYVPNKNPDIRIYFSHYPNGYPLIINIFPWELSEIDNLKYECHIDYVNNLEAKPERIQQVSVGKKDIKNINEFDVFISFCWPNLVFESSFFEDKINRLMIPKNAFRNRGYPIHLQQYIGFESINSVVTINEIRIKEIFI
ncbi:MAG: hypothetical protein ACYDIC_20400 [Desulfobaccales bacterium]